MPFAVTVTIDDQGRLAVNSPAPPPIVAKVLREASHVVERDLLVAAVKEALESERRVTLAPAASLADLRRNGGAPI
jgi:hypothetical protein